MKLIAATVAVLVGINIQAATPSTMPAHVSNVPAVQPVRGTVKVGNLPLDADGALRVSSSARRSPVVVELLDAPIQIPDGPSIELTLPRTVDTTGYSEFGIYIDPGICDYQPAIANYRVEGRWSADEPFTPVSDYRNGGPWSSEPGSQDMTHTLFRTINGEIRVTLVPDVVVDNCSGRAMVRNVRVYLFP